MLNAFLPKTTHTNALAKLVFTVMDSLASWKLIALIHRLYAMDKDVASQRNQDINVFAMQVKNDLDFYIQLETDFI